MHNHWIQNKPMRFKRNRSCPLCVLPALQPGGRVGSKASEAARLLAALRRAAERSARDHLSSAEIMSVANDIGLKGDVTAVIDVLNEAGKQGVVQAALAMTFWAAVCLGRAGLPCTLFLAIQ